MCHFIGYLGDGGIGIWVILSMAASWDGWGCLFHCDERKYWFNYIWLINDWINDYKYLNFLLLSNLILLRRSHWSISNLNSQFLSLQHSWIIKCLVFFNYFQKKKKLFSRPHLSETKKAGPDSSNSHSPKTSSSRGFHKCGDAIMPHRTHDGTTQPVSHRWTGSSGAKTEKRGRSLSLSLSVRGSVSVRKLLRRDTVE